MKDQIPNVFLDSCLIQALHFHFKTIIHIERI